MLKLRVLKERMEIPKKGTKIPTAKALRESGIPVLVQKTVGFSESAIQIIAYQNGYIVYQVGKRTTVFPVNLKEGYLYSSVVEEHKSMKTVSDLDSLDSDMLMPELLQMDIGESYFDEEEWFLHFMLIGEDRLAHNLSCRDRGRCISYSGISEECDLMDDKSEAFLDKLLNREMMEELLSVLNERQRQVVELYFEGQYTQEQIAKMMGMKGRTSVTNMLSRALKKMEQSFDPKEFRMK